MSNEEFESFYEELKNENEDLQDEDRKQFFYCPVCWCKIPNHNICGVCPQCGSEGFKPLREGKKILYYGLCNDCSNFYRSEFSGVKCNFGHVHLPKEFCKDYSRSKS